MIQVEGVNYREHGKGFTLRFDDMTSLLRFDELDTTINNEPLRPQSSRGGGGVFSGTDSWEEAVRLARNGWPDCPRNYQLQEEISSKLSRRIDFNTYMDVSGSDVDVGLYLAGEPECMFEFSDTQKDYGRIIDLQISVDYNGGVSTEDIINRGAAVVGIINALEDSGFRINLVATAPAGASWGDTKEDDFGIIQLNVKHSNEILDEDKVNFIVAHPSVLRRLFFAAWERTPMKMVERYGFYSPGCYGSTPIYKIPNYHYIGANEDVKHFRDWESTFKWAKKQMQKIMYREGIEQNAA